MLTELFKHTANYCEENVWHLCQNSDLTDFPKKVIVISNPAKYCAFWHQKSAQRNEPIWWDYHVVLLVRKEDKKLIYDLDSTLALPTTLKDYLRQTFKINAFPQLSHFPNFKIIDADLYIRSFYSDRQHMIDENGNYLFPPPEWPIIQSTNELSLEDLLDFSPQSKQPIYDVEGLINAS